MDDFGVPPHDYGNPYIPQLRPRCPRLRQMQSDCSRVRARELGFQSIAVAGEVIEKRNLKQSIDYE